MLAVVFGWRERERERERGYVVVVVGGRAAAATVGVVPFSFRHLFYCESVFFVCACALVRFFVFPVSFLFSIIIACEA